MLASKVFVTVGWLFGGTYCPSCNSLAPRIYTGPFWAPMGIGHLDEVFGVANVWPTSSRGRNIVWRSDDARVEGCWLKAGRNKAQVKARSRCVVLTRNQSSSAFSASRGRKGKRPMKSRPFLPMQDLPALIGQRNIALNHNGDYPLSTFRLLAQNFQNPCSRRAKAGASIPSLRISIIVFFDVLYQEVTVIHSLPHLTHRAARL